MTSLTTVLEGDDDDLVERFSFLVDSARFEGDDDDIDDDLIGDGLGLVERFSFLDDSACLEGDDDIDLIGDGLGLVERFNFLDDSACLEGVDDLVGELSVFILTTSKLTTSCCFDVLGGSSRSSAPTFFFKSGELP